MLGQYGAHMGIKRSVVGGTFFEALFRLSRVGLVPHTQNGCLIKRKHLRVSRRLLEKDQETLTAEEKEAQRRIKVNEDFKNQLAALNSKGGRKHEKRAKDEDVDNWKFGVTLNSTGGQETEKRTGDEDGDNWKLGGKETEIPRLEKPHGFAEDGPYAERPEERRLREAREEFQRQMAEWDSATSKGGKTKEAVVFEDQNMDRTTNEMWSKQNGVNMEVFREEDEIKRVVEAKREATERFPSPGSRDTAGYSDDTYDSSLPGEENPDHWDDLGDLEFKREGNPPKESYNEGFESEDYDKDSLFQIGNTQHISDIESISEGLSPHDEVWSDDLGPQNAKLWENLDAEEEQERLKEVRQLTRATSDSHTAAPGIKHLDLKDLASAKHRANEVKSIMRQIPTHVVALTTAYVDSYKDRKLAGTPRGMTISSFTTVSMHPVPIVSFNIKRPSHTLEALQSSRRFMIHFLTGNALGTEIARDLSRPSDCQMLFKGGLGGLLRISSHVVSFQKPHRPNLQSVKLPVLHAAGVMDSILCCELLNPRHSATGMRAEGFNRAADHFVVLAEVVEILKNEDANRAYAVGAGAKPNALLYLNGAFLPSRNLDSRGIIGLTRNLPVQQAGEHQSTSNSNRRGGKGKKGVMGFLRRMFGMKP